MGRTSLLTAAALLALLVLGAVGTYAYDSARSDTIADGVMVGGVDVGGMSTAAATTALEQQLSTPLSEPIRVKAAGERWRLRARRADVRVDVDGMVADALAASREGNVVTRSWRGVTGGTVDASIPPRVTYSREAVEKLVAKVQEEVEREAQDATVEASLGGLSTTKAEDGLDVHGRALEEALYAELEAADDDNLVKAETKAVKPKVTEADLADEYPHYLIVDRGGKQLSYYQDMKLADTYTVAVGQVGYDTPSGTYSIQNKAVDPVWSVPNSAWAGSLAGTTIPGGAAENPLKARWLGIYDGVGIHGTDVTSSLGTAGSHGCIRMSIPEVIELYDKVPVGTPVYIG